MSESSRRNFLRSLGTGLVAAPFVLSRVAAADEILNPKSYRDYDDSLLERFKGQVTTTHEVRHSYFPDERWEKKAPDFVEFNRIREDNDARRDDVNIIKHRPRSRLANNRYELMIDFQNDPPHPQVHDHWWSWIEVWDNAGEPAVLTIEPPAPNETLWGKAGIQWMTTMHLPKPLKGNLYRVRAYCVTHGLYTRYLPI